MLKQIFAVFLMVAAIVIMSCDDAGTGPTETLDAPVITVTPDTSKIVVTWDAVDGATSYTLYHSTTAGVTDQSTSVQIPTGTSFTHISLTNGVTYYYRVAAKGSGGITSELSEEKSGMPISAVIDPPENVTATGWDSKITLSWDLSNGASYYTIYWDTTAGVTEQSNIIDSITPLGYEHEKLTNGKTYYYRIAANDVAGTSSDLSSEVYATPKNPVTAPENLTAKPGNTFITLDIDPYSGGKEALFRIYRATAANVTTSSDTVVDQTGKGIRFPHTITGLTNDTSYYFKVSAIVSGNESDLSNEASATPSDTIPLDIPKVTAKKGNAQVTLEWSAITGAASYTIFWDTATGVNDQSDTIIVAAAKPGYLHTGLTNYTTYYYRVNAVDAGGTASALSDEVSATPDTVVSDLVPKNVVATAGAGQVTISWDEVTGADAVFINWATSPNFTKPEGTIKDNVVSPYTHSGLTAGKTYYYRVAAWDGKDVYESKEVSATPTK